MKIKKITITNFRGIDSLSLDFIHPAGKPLDLVVLAGPNGCGKTSVLEACLFACQKQDLPLGKRQHSKSNVRIGNDKFEIVTTFYEEEGKQFEERKERLVGSWENNGLRLSYPEIISRPHDFPVEYFSSWRYPVLPGNIPVVFSPMLPTTPEYRLRQIKQYLINLTARKPFELKKQGISDKKAVNSADPFIKINRGWEIFYPERHQEFLAEPASEVVEEGFDIFLTNESGQKLPVDSLSSGEIEVFTMLGWFAIQDFSDGIILIDEPELHLHSAWHRAIMRALRTVLPATQIICATHSPEIIDSVYSYERFTLLPENDPRIRLVKSFKS